MLCFLCHISRGGDRIFIWSEKHCFDLWIVASLPLFNKSLWYIALQYGFFLIIFLWGWGLHSIATLSAVSNKLWSHQILQEILLEFCSSVFNLHLILWECIFWMFLRYCVSQGKIKHNIKYANIESSVGTRY